VTRQSGILQYQWTDNDNIRYQMIYGRKCLRASTYKTRKGPAKMSQFLQSLIITITPRFVHVVPSLCTRLSTQCLIFAITSSNVNRFWNFHILHGRAMRFLRGGENYYIHFVDNLLLFPTVKEFSKSVNIWWSYCKNSTPRFSETQCIVQRT